MIHNVFFSSGISNRYATFKFFRRNHASTYRHDNSDAMFHLYIYNNASVGWTYMYRHYHKGSTCRGLSRCRIVNLQIKRRILYRLVSIKMKKRFQEKKQITCRWQGTKTTKVANNVFFISISLMFPTHKPVNDTPWTWLFTTFVIY